MSRILIDTNIYSDAARGDPYAVQVFRSADEILVIPVVVGELLAGFKNGQHESQNREKFQRFLNKPRIRLVEMTQETADFYAVIFTELKRQGTPIPTNDIWIAAATMEHGAKLASRDRHFKKIKNLLIYSG